MDPPATSSSSFTSSSFSHKNQRRWGLLLRLTSPSGQLSCMFFRYHVLSLTRLLGLLYKSLFIAALHHSMSTCVTNLRFVFHVIIPLFLLRWRWWHRSMGGRTFKKYLLLAVLTISLLGFFYQYNSPVCFSKPGLTEYVGPEVSASAFHSIPFPSTFMLSFLRVVSSIVLLLPSWSYDTFLSKRHKEK